MPRGKKGPVSYSSINFGSDYTDEEREFLQAIDTYKREAQRPYPTWREVLRVVHALGYRRVATPTSSPAD